MSNIIIDCLLVFNDILNLFFQRAVTCMMKIVIRIHIFYRRYKCIENRRFCIVKVKVKIFFTALVDFGMH